MWVAESDSPKRAPAIKARGRAGELELRSLSPRSLRRNRLSKHSNFTPKMLLATAIFAALVVGVRPAPPALEVRRLALQLKGCTYLSLSVF